MSVCLRRIGMDGRESGDPILQQPSLALYILNSESGHRRLVQLNMHRSFRSLFGFEASARLSCRRSRRVDRPTATASAGKWEDSLPQEEQKMKEICHSGSQLHHYFPFFTSSTKRQAASVCSAGLLLPSSDPAVAAAWRVINFHQTRSLSHSAEFFPPASGLRSVGRGRSVVA